jgi:TolB-like protein/DNA-binding winged helix-turn-helix (wHTH) protein/Tfp pilus assembly protein PilF
MNPSGQKQGVLRFGIFELDLDNCELRKGGVLVKLQSQPFQLLALLSSRPGQVVTREEIRRALWGEETFVDFDQSINFCVNKLRDALDDDPQKPGCIETVPRKGYRFVAAIREPGAGPAEAAPKQKPGWLLLAGAALFLLAIALAARTAIPPKRGARQIESLAVLPLENLSRDPEQDYFADGMTDDLIADLGKISALRVISRTSVVQYKKTRKTVPEIARELNVDAVLEGTVERDGGRVRITAQLIAAAPERHLWAEKYEARLSDVLTVQDSVAKAVAQAIQIRVTGQERSVLSTPHAVDPEAYEAYLKGRYLWAPGGEKNLQKSLEYFQQAVQKDPSYALAWAGMAGAYDRLASWGVLPRPEAASRARAAAEKALALDSTVVDAVIALAAVKMDYEWDWPGAEQLCKKAIQMSPNSALAHMRYAGLLATVGRNQEGVAEVRLARQSDPLDSVTAANLGWQLYLAHNYEEAEREGRKWFEWHPRYRGDYIFASIYLQTGRIREAVDELQLGASETHHPAVLELMYLGHALGVTGARNEGRKILAEMLALSHSRYVPPDYIAMVYEGLGDRDAAIQWYQKAVEERSINLWILPDQRLDPIRSDPRFQNLMRRMGLPR